MSGHGVRTYRRPAKGYYNYRQDTESFDLDKLKEMKDEDNEEIENEWFLDGKWEIDDELALLDEEDWEIWYDWFPKGTDK
jgi:hypothetical protein